MRARTSRNESCEANYRKASDSEAMPIASSPEALCFGNRPGTGEITMGIHRDQIMRKMDARSLAELVRMDDALGITRRLDLCKSRPA